MKLDKAELKRGLDALQQIAAVVHFAHQSDLKVRAVGTGSSWSKLTNVRDILIGEFEMKPRVTMLTFKLDQHY